MFYNTLFKRNSVFVSTIFLSAFSFSIGYDLLTTAWWDAHNRGVSLEPLKKHFTARLDYERSFFDCARSRTSLCHSKPYNQS